MFRVFFVELLDRFPNEPLTLLMILERFRETKLSNLYALGSFYLTHHIRDRLIQLVEQLFQIRFMPHRPMRRACHDLGPINRMDHQTQ